MECKNYDIDSDGNPIILREKAALYIEGKGQVGIGFKKMVYAASGGLETPLEFPGYKLTGGDGTPIVEAASCVIPDGTDIYLQGFCGGTAKSGGSVQKGTLGSSGENQGVYGEVVMTGKPLGADPGAVSKWGMQSPYDWTDYDGYRHFYDTGTNVWKVIDTLSAADRLTRTRKAYLYRVSEVTPVLFRFKVSDRLTRESATITSPPVPAAGDCLYFNHSWNVEADGTFSGAVSNLGIMSQNGNDYHSWLSVCEPDVEVVLQHRAAAAGLKILRHTMQNIGFRQSGVSEFVLEMQGYDLVRRLSEEPMKETRSYDDKDWTIAELMTELCYLFGITIHIAAGVGNDPLPKSSDANNPLWTFTPGNNRWEALNRVRKAWGGILYPNDNDELAWNPRPTSASAADYVFTRGESIIQEPKIEARGGWKTRIFITGKAGATLLGEYQKDDKLVGAWYHKTLEGKIGRTKEYMEINDSLADWDAVKRRGDEIFLQTTGPGTYLTGKIPEVLISSQDCRKILPWQVVQWKDALLTDYNDKKFAFISLGTRTDKFTAEAEFEAKML